MTAEWIDLEDGRDQPRAGEAGGPRRRCAASWHGSPARQLEVALEATTGWRFFVEELRAVGAVVHLAEPAETAARRGRKKRPKTDRADARHHRELLLAGRLPESWIPPDHILDLRAQVRLRHTLGRAALRWHQRIQAVLYHHGCPQRRQLMTADGRDWLDALVLPDAARQQITVARAIVKAVETQIAPLHGQLRSYARRQMGCRAMIGAHHGIGPLCAVTILAELGDSRAVREQPRRGPLRRHGHHRVPVRPPPLTRASVPPGAAGAPLGAVRGGPGRAPPRFTLTATTTSRRPSGWAVTAPA